MKQLNEFVHKWLFIWILLIGAMGEPVCAQDDFDPVSPPEPGSFSVITTSYPENCATFEQTYANGKVIIRALPFTGYDFVAWKIEGEIINDIIEYSFVPVPNKTTYIVAELRFNPKNPAEPGEAKGNLVIVNTNESAGRVTPSGKGEYAIGSLVTLQASSFSGYRFSGWYEDNKLLSSSSSYRIQIKKSQTTIQAHFVEESPGITVGGGSLSGSSDGEVHGSVEVNGTLRPGQTVEVIAKPEEGYAFSGWYLNGLLVTEAEMNYSLYIASDNLSLIAMFQEIPFSLQITGGGSGEEVGKWASVTRIRGSVARLSAKVVENYTFVGWYKGGELLSRDPEFDFNISGLRAALPEITARYVKGALGNEITSSADNAIQTYMSRGNLQITSSLPLQQVDILDITGKRISRIEHVMPFSSVSIPVPKTIILIHIHLNTGEKIIRKLY